MAAKLVGLVGPNLIRLVSDAARRETIARRNSRARTAAEFVTLGDSMVNRVMGEAGLACLVVACGGDGGESPNYGSVFADDALPVFELVIPPDCEAALAQTPFEYCRGDLTYLPGTDGGSAVTAAGVGIRLKGSFSFRDLGAKAAFKVKMDEFVEGQRLVGLRRLTLNNMVQDPSMLHERVAYRVFRAAGVPAPLCNHARVYVNGEYFGLYANVETIDDEFAEARWDPAPGNLYEAPAQEYLHDLLPEYQDRFELESNQDLADRSDLAAAIEGVNGPSASFYEDAGQVIDWDEWLKMAAAQAIIADGDGYFGARNNYKLYHELALDRFLVLPWGMDQTFGATDGDPRTYMDYAVDHSSSMNVRSHVFERCQDDATCWARYLDALESLAALFAELPLLAEMDVMVMQIEIARQEDTQSEHGDGEVDEYRAAMRAFIAERPGNVRGELADFGR
jgi:spore coat protein CotH